MADQLDLGTLLIHLKADSAEFAQGFNDAESISDTVWNLITKNAALSEVAVAAAFAGMAAAAVKAWADIEDTVQSASQKMGNTSQQLAAQMQETARAIAANGSTGATELAASYDTLAKAGYSAQQSIMALPVVDQAATASGNNLTDTINALTGAQKALGLQTSNTAQNTQNLSDISNVLIKASQESSSTFTELGNALSGLTGVELKQFGLSMRDAVAVMASLADAGVPVESTGRTLRTMLESLSDSATSNSYAFKQLGIDVLGANGQLLPFATILDNMRTHLAGLSDAQKQSALETLGFTNQTSSLAKVLIDSSGSVDAYVKSFQDVNDVTKTAAEQGDNTLDKQFDKITNSAKELVYQVGEQLAPVIEALLKTFNDAITSCQGLNTVWQFFITNIGPALLTVIGLIGDSFQGWMMVFDTLEVAFDAVWVAIMKTLSGAVVVINAAVGAILDTIVEGANDAIAALNKILPAAHQLTTIDLSGFIAKLTSNPLSGAADDAVTRLKSDYADLQALASKPLFSDTLQKNYDAATKAIVGDNQAIVASTKGMMQDVAKAVQISPEQQLYNQVNAAFNDPKTGVGASGYGLDNKSLFPSGAAKDPLSQTIGSSNVTDAQMVGLQDQLKQEEKAYTSAQDAIDKARLAGTDTTNKQIEDLMNKHAATIHAIQLEMADAAIENAGSIFGSLTTIAQNTVGAQSGIYQTLFAMSKAFAVADATIKMGQAIANAMASGATIYDQIADAVIVTAQMSAIISSIQSTTLSGVGAANTKAPPTIAGAKADGGPVMGGSTYLVGEEGPELFQPSSGGTIIPNDVMQGMGGNGNNVQVNINNYSSAQATVQKSTNSQGDVYDVIIKQVKQSLATDFQNGTGPVNKSLANAYGLQRGKTT